MLKYLSILLLLCGWTVLTASAQNQTNTPYSAFGVGDLQKSSSSRAFGMSGVGVGLSDPFTINRLNPASYPNLWVTSFDISGYYQRTGLRQDTMRNNLNTGGLQSLSFVYKKTSLKEPFISRFAVALGLNPYSSMGYEFQNNFSIDTVSYASLRLGDGGLNDFYLGMGYRVLKRKNLSVGFNASYIFGKFNNQWQTISDQSPAINFVRNRTVNCFGIKAGLMYSDSIGVSHRRDSVNLHKKLTRFSQDSLKIVAKTRPIQRQIDSIARAPHSNPELVKEKYAKYRADSIELQAKREAIKADPKIFKEKFAEYRDDSIKLNKKYRESVAERDSLRLIKSLDKLKKDSTIVDFEKKRAKLHKTSHPIEWRVGGTFDYFSKLNNKQTDFLNYREYADGDGFSDSTVVLQYVEGTLNAPPPSFGVGISLFQHLKFTLAADFVYQNWSSFQLVKTDPRLSSSYKMLLGGEYIPDYRDARNIFKRMAYRAGVSFEKTYLNLRDKDIYRYGFSVGLGIPLSRFLPSPGKLDFARMYIFNTSRLNLGFELLSRGTPNGGLVGETSYRVMVGISFNEIWFSTKKYQ